MKKMLHERRQTLVWTLELLYMCMFLLQDSRSGDWIGVLRTAHDIKVLKVTLIFLTLFTSLLVHKWLTTEISGKSYDSWSNGSQMEPAGY